MNDRFRLPSKWNTCSIAQKKSFISLNLDHIFQEIICSDRDLNPSYTL